MSKRRGGQPRNANAKRHNFYSRSGDTEQGPTATARRKASQVSPPVATRGPAADDQPTGPTPIPTLADIARDLHHHQQQLARYIVDLSTMAAGAIAGDDPTLTTSYIAAQSLYGQNSARMARIIRANDELPKGEDGTESITDAINYALSQVNNVKKKLKQLAEDREL